MKFHYFSWFWYILWWRRDHRDVAVLPLPRARAAVPPAHHTRSRRRQRHVRIRSKCTQNSIFFGENSKLKTFHFRFSWNLIFSSTLIIGETLDRSSYRKNALIVKADFELLLQSLQDGRGVYIGRTKGSGLFCMELVYIRAIDVSGRIVGTSKLLNDFGNANSHLVSISGLVVYVLRLLCHIVHAGMWVWQQSGFFRLGSVRFLHELLRIVNFHL